MVCTAEAGSPALTHQCFNRYIKIVTSLDEGAHGGDDVVVHDEREVVYVLRREAHAVDGLHLLEKRAFSRLTRTCNGNST